MRGPALVLEVQSYRNRKYIGVYMAVLGRVDGIVFTAGIGENDAIVRAASLKGLEAFSAPASIRRKQPAFQGGPLHQQPRQHRAGVCHSDKGGTGDCPGSGERGEV